MDDVDLISWCGCFSAFAAPFLGLFTWGMYREWRASKEGVPPPPGLRAANDFSGSLGILAGMAALISLGFLACRQEGWLRFVPLALINLLMQPICLLFMAAGVYRLIQGCRGRLTFGFRVIPQGEMSDEQYRSLVGNRIITGVIGMLFGCGLSLLCVWPLL